MVCSWMTRRSRSSTAWTWSIRCCEASGHEVWIENDADAALLGETWRGDARGAQNAVMLTIGTGLGGAAIIQGRLFARPSRPSIRRSATCGIPAALGEVAENVVAGPAIDRLAKSSGFASGAELLRSGGDVMQVVRDALGQVLWNVLHLYAPEVVILGGGVMQEHFDLFAPDLRATARAAYMVGGSHVRIISASLGNNAGIVGAARTILDPQIVRDGPARDGSSRAQLLAYPDHEAMSQAAAQRIIDVLRTTPDALICAATGATPQRMYELLAVEARRNPQWFAHARVIKLDEWAGIRPDLPTSCEAYLQEHVVRPWGLDSSRYTAFAINPPDPSAECRRIAAWLAKHGPIDLAILGIGLSGHIGLNEPADALTSGPHVAQLTPQSLTHTMLAGQNPSGVYGLTLGISDLLRSREILLLAGGQGKAQVFARFATGPVTPHLPVSMLHLHPRAACVYDAAAMGR